MPLFERNNLTDGTQVTVNRYLQDDSTIVNGRDSWTDGTDATMETVSSGKTLYITDIYVYVDSTGAAGTDWGFITDFGGSGAKIQINFEHLTVGQWIRFVFATPLYFTNLFYWDANAAATLGAQITYSGWEE